MSDDEYRISMGKVCGIAGIVLNMLLFAGKIFAGIITGSISIVADALNNLSDAGSSIVTFAGFHIASHQADPEHPFGHGRVEYVSGFIVSTLIIIMGYELIRDSVLRIIHPEKVTYATVAVAVLIISILIKLYMLFYNRSIGKQIDSAALMAVAKDSFSDCIATGIVLLSGILTNITGFIYLDGISGTLIGLFVLFEGLSAAKDTLNPLLGQAPDPDFVENVRKIMMEQDSRISGIHDMVVHDYGPGRRMVSLHAEVPADGDLIELHEAIDAAEEELEKKLHCEAVIHMDPIVTDDPKVLAVKNKVTSIIEEIDPALSIHDFRIVAKQDGPRLVFDLLEPYGFRMSKEDIEQEVTEQIHKKISTDYSVSIHIDTDYSVRVVK